MRTRLRSRILLLCMTFGLLLAIPAVALADNINDNITDSVNSALQLTAGDANSTPTAEVRVVGNNSAGDPDTGCNFDTATESLTIKFNTPTGVTATALDGATSTPGQMKFTACGVDQTVQFSASSAAFNGNYTVTANIVQNATDGSFLNNVQIPIRVTGGLTDTDGDGVADSADNCPSTANANQADADGDGIGDACDSTPDPPADTTAPVITSNIQGTLGNDDWYTSNVTLSWSVTDPESTISSKTGCDTVNITSDQQATTYTCTATSAGGTDTKSVTIKRDATAPVNVSGAPNRDPDHNGWYNSPVSIVFQGTDVTSGIGNCSTVPYNGPDGTGLTVDGSCTDQAGNESAQVASSAFKYDATKPTNIAFSGISNGDSFDFGNVPAQSSLGCLADDATSGFDSCSIVSGYGTSVGNHALTAKAFDQAGNSATKSLSYEVVAWTLKGFYQPVDMGIHNTMKGGQTVPLKFEILQTLSGNELTDTSVIKTFTQKVNCTTSGGVDAIEDYATGDTSLRYDTTSGQFIFNWKTPKAPGTCYRVTMTTQDGSSISADFTLK